ncbi:hypothetical protein [Streptomyces hoynatensis]|uniref:Uncharacterized protein n=1 Tax=Streptomyces hoynatensis TaxID=1141874 RepID=A0A3A9YFQ6_9ACTN|nr:hypothetical protein [Streptomyces hoynatensis]RKN35932.1 hypothetical protein D7294_30345 [Streptomyces hoynatensis]
MAFEVARVEREIRGGTAYWVHLYGDGRFTSDAEALRAAKREARKWAKELGFGKPHHCFIGYGSGMLVGHDWRYSVSFGFEGRTD